MISIRIGEVECIRQTEKAILVKPLCPDAIELMGSDDVWIPQSQVDADSEVWRLGDEGVLFVSEWFAEQRGWT